jgi:TPR repeat protein
MRSEGEGMQKNSDQGRTLKRKAFDGLNAMTGDPYALNILGIMAYSGEVIPQDTTEALRLYKQSADFGYAPAQYNYARLILNGGVAGDAEEANAYKEKAAAQNYP